MKPTRTTRLKRINAGDLALLLAAASFILSLPIAVLALIFSGPGNTVKLSGFFTYSSSGSINTALLIAYPFVNALGGLLTGFLCAWLYNALARCFGGVRVDIG